HLGVAGGQRIVRRSRLADELDIAEPLGREEILDDILRRLADARGPGEPERGRLRWRLGGGWSGVHAPQPRSPSQRETTKKPPPAELSGMPTHRGVPRKHRLDSPIQADWHPDGLRRCIAGDIVLTPVARAKRMIRLSLRHRDCFIPEATEKAA